MKQHSNYVRIMPIHRKRITCYVIKIKSSIHLRGGRSKRFGFVHTTNAATRRETKFVVFLLSKTIYVFINHDFRVRVLINEMINNINMPKTGM